MTNPTHFAVALEWNELEMDAPVVVAKGADLIAKRIREIAIEHNVPIMENPPLARTLYERAPLQVWQGVAALLALALLASWLVR